MNNHRIATRGALAFAVLFAVAVAAPAIADDTKSTTTAAPAATDKATAAKTRDYAPGIDKMLAKKAELGLTAEQEARITEIRKDLQAKNQPLVEQIESAIGARPTPEQMKTMTAEQREDFVTARMAEAKGHEELQPVYKQLRENRKAAWDQVKEVLTDEQEAKVEQWKKDKKKSMEAKADKSKEASAEKPKTNY